MNPQQKKSSVMHNDLIVGLATGIAVIAFISIVAAGLFLAQGLYERRRMFLRDYLRKPAPKPDWFPGEKEEADAWLAKQRREQEEAQVRWRDRQARPPEHEMCRCAIDEPWITIPGGRSYTLAEVQAMRKRYLEPIDSSTWTGL